MLFYIVWFIIFCGCVYVFLDNFKDWISPKLTVVATVVAKKTVVVNTTQNGCASTNYMYQVSFRVENGEVLAMYVPRSDYKLLVPGDVGRLTAKRTQYISFERC